MARRITLDQLAAMVAKGFEDLRREMQDGFASLRAVVDHHTAVHADHSRRFNRIERKLDNSIGRLDDHDVRLQALEKRRTSRS